MSLQEKPGVPFLEPSPHARPRAPPSGKVSLGLGGAAGTAPAPHNNTSKAGSKSDKGKARATQGVEGAERPAARRGALGTQGEPGRQRLCLGARRSRTSKRPTKAHKGDGRSSARALRPILFALTEFPIAESHAKKNLNKRLLTGSTDHAKKNFTHTSAGVRGEPLHEICLVLLCAARPASGAGCALSLCVRASPISHTHTPTNLSWRFGALGVQSATSHPGPVS